MTYDLTYDWVWWVVQFSLNFLDFVMVYVITHRLLNWKIVVKKEHILLCVGYTLLQAPVYFLGNMAFRMTIFLFFLFLIRFLSKRKLADVLLIYAMDFSLSVIQFPLALAAFFLGLHYHRLSFLVIQIITVILVFLICKYGKLNKLFNAIQANILLKLLLFNVAFIVILFFFIFNFSYTFFDILFFLILIAVIGGALFPLIKKTYKLAVVNTISHHDLINELMSTGIAMRQNEDYDEARRLFDDLAQTLGIDFSGLNMEDVDHSDIETQIVYFIEMKNQKKTDIKFISDIVYWEHHQSIELKSVLKWLGGLLDNAIETISTFPIHIRLRVDKDRIELSVENEHLGGLPEELYDLFEKGYSTKGNGRGFGLYQLRQEVESLGGKVYVFENHREVYHQQYLVVYIEFKMKENADV